jgi:hypothetical protein
MKAKWLGTLVASLLLLALGALLGSRGGSAQGQPPGGPRMPGGPRYTVIETEGFKLLVTDNGANQLYYYATDKDAPVGSPLLRGRRMTGLHFWATGYWVSTVGRDEEAVRKYIREQEGWDRQQGELFE